MGDTLMSMRQRIQGAIDAVEQLLKDMHDGKDGGILAEVRLRQISNQLEILQDDLADCLVDMIRTA
jgi:hypothetical protein